MKKQIQKIKENVAKMQHALVGIDEEDSYIEDDSLLEDYTQKYDRFISDELSYYFRLL